MLGRPRMASRHRQSNVRRWLSALLAHEAVAGRVDRRLNERDQRERPPPMIGASSQEQAIAQALREGRFWELASLSIAMPDCVPTILHRSWRSGAISPAQLPDAVCAVWIGRRAPVSWKRGHGLGPRGWVQMFQAAGYLHRVESATAANFELLDPSYPTPSELCARPTGGLTVWRGATTSRRRGMSWTLHRECAEGFAQVAADFGDAELVRARVPGCAVLAAFADGREQEIVVNTRLLPRDIEVVERQPWGRA